MKRFLSLVTLAVLALGIAACDDIILPGHPGDRDTTGGGRDTTGGGDRDTTGGGDRDTNWIDSLVISGPILDPEGNPTVAPENQYACILWDNGHGQQIAWGNITLSRDRSHYTARVGGMLPEEMLYAPGYNGGVRGGAVHGEAMICLTNRPIRQGEVIELNAMYPHAITAQLMHHALIYNTGREMYAPWAQPWIENFDIGYSMAIPGFVGYVPVKEREYPLVQLFHI